jgi:hypothetical protein
MCKVAFASKRIEQPAPIQFGPFRHGKATRSGPEVCRISPGISTYCTLGLVQHFSGVLTHGFYSGLATNRPGRRQKDNDKVYDTSMKIEAMGDGDIQLRQKLAIIPESSRKADLSKLNGQNAC